MQLYNDRAEGVKVAYIGGGSRGWAWNLMRDLGGQTRLSGDVYLYDIDFAAAKVNEVIGNRASKQAASRWVYRAVPEIGEALTGADFVIISILPGTFAEMASDVHAPERYGVYQSVGDTTGPGGVIRALRAVPMFRYIAECIEKYCPDAWVINYTNPMTVLMQTLYAAFPKIKAFGCCHEVFGTQKLLCAALSELRGVEAEREDMKVNVVGLNHFTWLTEAKCRGLDVFPVYREFCEKYAAEGYPGTAEKGEADAVFLSRERVKIDLFLRYGYIAAAGDRHLAEFMDGDTYLRDPETVKSWGFVLTPVSYRTADLEKRLARSSRLARGEEVLSPAATGEEGVRQMSAILGFEDFVTNVNLPNLGQIPNLPRGAVVETNARFSSGSVRPVFAGEVPEGILPLISRTCEEQRLITEGAMSADLDLAFRAFMADPLTRLNEAEGRKLFNEMLRNTAAYLPMYRW